MSKPIFQHIFPHLTTKIYPQADRNKKETYIKNSRQYILNKLYNQDVAPEDAQVTSFLYHKTLALECFQAIFSICSIALALMLFFEPLQFSKETKKRAYSFVLIFTFLGALTIIFQGMAKMKWSIAKKQKNISLIKQRFYLAFKIIVYLPCSIHYANGVFIQVPTSESYTQVQINSLLCFYMLFVRSFCVITFLIHSELYYGSRPDRLSRIYTVNFATVNAVRFIVNEKPILFLTAAFVYNFLVFPLSLLLLQGSFNEKLQTYVSCLHFVMITEFTVGFGDIYVISSIGKIITYLCMIIGAVSTSFLLIVFRRFMKFDSNEQNARLLLKSLESQQQIKLKHILRIEKEHIYFTSRFAPEEKQKEVEKIKTFRYRNNREINFLRANTQNLKKSIILSFAQLCKSLKVVKEKSIILQKCIEKLSREPGTKYQTNHKQIYLGNDMQKTKQILKTSSHSRNETKKKVYIQTKSQKQLKKPKTDFKENLDKGNHQRSLVDEKQYQIIFPKKKQPQFVAKKINIQLFRQVDNILDQIETRRFSKLKL